MLTFLFSVLFHPGLRKKSYCKRHLKLKMVEFCRCILPYVPFKAIIYAASSLTKTLRFKAVKELVNDVFADKSQEFEMCENAKVTQCRDLNSLYETVQGINARGVAFGYESLRCGICEQLITCQNQFRSSLQGARKDSLSMEIFDCAQGENAVQGVGGSFVNHTFHGKCIRRFAQDEHDKSKKATVSELPFRCPVCYPKNQSITWSEPPKKPVQKQDDSNSDSES